MPRGHQPAELGAGSGPRGRDPIRWWPRGGPDAAPTGRVVDNEGCNTVGWWMCGAPNGAYRRNCLDNASSDVVGWFVSSGCVLSGRAAYLTSRDAVGCWVCCRPDALAGGMVNHASKGAVGC